ncbi:HD domain-containing protein [Allobaculum sp. Allo2]|nr:HD domain-containing protein [Allobaculum sp. Allo2]UNT93293.1 HD domain-containing protein [Allobaculum sp. Allo2]
MKKRLEAAAQKMPLSQTMQALAYMEKAHAGQLRRTGNPQQPVVPYAIHPLSLAVHALALGITDDDLLSAALLHDVCEDCDIACADLPFSRNVQEIVSRLTKDAGCFSKAKMREYIEESERRILPMAEPIRAARPEWDAPVFLLEYQMVSLITALRPLVYERL